MMNKFKYEMAEEITPENNDGQPEDNAGNQDPANNTDPVEPEENKKPIEEKVEEKPEDKTEDKTEELNKEIEGLNAEIDRLKQLETDKATLEQKVSDLESQINQANTDKDSSSELAKEYEDVINGMLNAQIEAIPENMRELIPANLNLKEKMAWLNKASELGLFKVQDKNIDIEIGKPLNPNNSKQAVDTANASPSTLITMAYSNSTIRKK